MRGEEHAGLRPTRLCRTGQLDDLVVVRVCPKTLGYSAGQTASWDRTDDLKLAKLPLSQLSYGPTSIPHAAEIGGDGGSG